MEYKITGNMIYIIGKDEFCPLHILECGQIFRFGQVDGNYFVLVGEHRAEIFEEKNGYKIVCDDPDFFVNYFDLKTSYAKIKGQLKKTPIINEAIKEGNGLRILMTPFFETAISFIISANNNMKRIKLILNRLCEKLGKDMGSYYTFPTKEYLLKTDEKFWTEIGAGYRSKYLPKAIGQLANFNESIFCEMTTEEVRKKLISFSGIGPKVADCIMLFSLSRFDSFPVDVWMEKVFIKHFGSAELTRVQMSKQLVKKFGNLSGYAQQYLFNLRQKLAY